MEAQPTHERPQGFPVWKSPAASDRGFSLGRPLLGGMPPQPRFGATVILAMPKRTSNQQDYSWAIYHIRGTPARFVGIVDAPDERSAIKKATEEFGVPENLRNRLIARPRD